MSEYISRHEINVACIVRLDAGHWELKARDCIGRLLFHGQLSCRAAALHLAGLLERSHFLMGVEVWE